MKPEKLCSIASCNRPPVGRGWCSMHYGRWRKHGDPLVTFGPGGWDGGRERNHRICLVEECGRKAIYKTGGVCRSHYERWKRNGDLIYRRSPSPPGGTVCAVPNCSRRAASGGLCSLHYARRTSNGDANLVQRPSPTGPTALARQLGVTRQRAHQIMNKEAANARHALYKARLTGRVEKAEACERCGLRQDDLEGHHSDYGRPLDVRWLCPRCHAIEHPHTPKLILVHELV